MLFVIEHLEPGLSEWLHIEYSHVARIVGRKRLLITNVRKKSELNELAKVARVERRRVQDMFEQRELVVLDPKARKGLSAADLLDKRAFVIGGILGEHPPLGRTRELLTKSMPMALARNLGKQQFAIDGAAYMAKQVLGGKRLQDIPVQFGLELRISEIHSTFLPYAYPLEGDRPLISRELIAYLKRT